MAGRYINNGKVDGGTIIKDNKGGLESRGRGRGRATARWKGLRVRVRVRVR